MSINLPKDDQRNDYDCIVSREEVLLHFLCMEGKTEELLRSYLKWEIHDQSKTANAEQPLKAYVNSRSDVNPALVYLIGTDTDKRYENVDSWCLKWISMADIYTCGINEAVNSDLDDVKGNLSEFALKHAHKYPEFSLHKANNGEEVVIIVAEQTQNGKNGTYELLDGAHRLVNICRRDGKEILAYVAKMKK